MTKAKSRDSPAIWMRSILYHHRRLVDLGYDVTLQEKPAAASHPPVSEDRTLRPALASNPGAIADFVSCVTVSAVQSRPWPFQVRRTGLARADPDDRHLRRPGHAVAVADFDGDGNADIAATEEQPSGGSNLFVVHLGHGSSSQFDGASTFPVVGDLQTYTDTPQMAVGDVDGDGEPDVVVVAGYAGAMSVLLSRAAGGTTTTTTTLACNSIATCLAALTTTLPSPSGASNKKLKHVASKLAAHYKTVTKTLTHAASKTGKKQDALYAKTKNQLQGLEALATKAASKGTLGVPLPPLQAAVAALLAQIP